MARQARDVRRLDIDGGFEVHDHRDGLKVLRQDAGSWRLSNRGEYACPACGRLFERLFVTDEPTVTFNSAPSSPICLARTPDQLLLLTHPE